MQPDEHTTTDPIQEEAPYRYPTLARWFGIDVAAQQIADALVDHDALEEALATLRTADTTVDAIEPELPPADPSLMGTHT